MSSTEERKFVAFRLNQEFYAVDVAQVTEVFTPTSITEIPQSEVFVSGVINYRGEIVTVIDLKKRLNIEDRKIKSEYDTLLEEEEERLYVIIVNSGTSVVGLLVDYVEAVIGITGDKIQASVDLVSGKANTGFLEGVARTEYGLTILLALEIILSDYDVVDTSQLAQIREKLLAESGDADEIVVRSSSIVDLKDDDIDAFTKSSSAKDFKKVEASSSFGESPLNLEKLTKSELIKIAIEMNISDVSTRSTKAEIIAKINSNLGN